MAERRFAVGIQRKTPYRRLTTEHQQCLFNRFNYFKRKEQKKRDGSGNESNKFGHNLTGPSGFIPWFGYHHLLMLLIAIAIILLCKSNIPHLSRAKTNSIPALLLAGCSSTSPLIPGIFLISLYYQPYAPTYSPTQVDPGVTSAIANIVGAACLEVRVGYFGICVTPDGGGFLCSNNATALAEQINIDQDPLNLIWVAQTFKDAVVFPYLMYVFPNSN